MLEMDSKAVWFDVKLKLFPLCHADPQYIHVSDELL